MSEPTTPSPSDSPAKEELKLALKAFRKRLKVTRLDDESRGFWRGAGGESGKRREAEREGKRELHERSD